MSSTRVNVALVVALSMLTVCLFLWLSRPDWLFQRGNFKIGNEMVLKVEAFRKSTGHVPETLEEVGIDNPDLNVFYKRIGGDEYCVWFGTSLGQSETFDSRTKKWETAYGGC